MAVTVNVHKSTRNKLEAVLWGLRDSNGYLLGSSPTAPAAGNQDGSGMLQLFGAKNFPFQPNDPDRPNQIADGGLYHTFINNPTDTPSSNLTFAADDKDFRALVQSLSVVDKAGGSFVMVQPRTPSYRNLFFMAYAPADSDDPDNAYGQGMYDGVLVLNSKIFPKGGDGYSSDGLPTYGYGMVTNYGLKYPWGHAFAVADEGSEASIALDFSWPYRPLIWRWTLDGTQTTFNLPQQLAEDSADNLLVAVNGTELDWIASTPGASAFEADTTANTLTLGDAGTSGDVLVAMFGW